MFFKLRFFLPRLATWQIPSSTPVAICHALGTDTTSVAVSGHFELICLRQKRKKKNANVLGK